MSSVNVNFDSIKEKIKCLRKTSELSQEMFGKSIGLRRQDIHAIETGARKPGLTVLYRIAVEYKISLDWLILGLDKTD